MGYVARARTGLIVVLAPFLQLPVLADLEIGDALERSFKLFAEVRIDPQGLGRAHGGMEKRVDDLVIHGGPDRLPAHRPIRHFEAVLRRMGRVRYEMALADRKSV